MNETPEGNSSEPVLTPEYPPAEVDQSASRKSSNPLMRRVGLVVAALVLGMAIIFFALYLPVNQQLKAAQTRLDETSVKLEAAQKELGTTTTELAELKTRFANTNDQLGKANLSLQLFKMQMDVSYARLALGTNDNNTGRQALTLAEKDLQLLLVNLPQGDLSKGLTERMTNIRTYLTADPAKALEELRILGENLSMISDSMR